MIGNWAGVTTEGKALACPENRPLETRSELGRILAIHGMTGRYFLRHAEMITTTRKSYASNKLICGRTGGKGGGAMQTGEAATITRLEAELTALRERNRELEERLRTLPGADTTWLSYAQEPLFIYDVDPDGTIRWRWANAAQTRLTGYGLDAIGQTPEEFAGPEIGPLMAANFRRCIETRQPLTYTVERTYPSGKRFVQCALAPVCVDGRVTQLVGSVHDLTEVKALADELRQQGEKYRAVFDNVRDAIFLHPPVDQDPSGKFLDVNLAACRLTGYSREELLARGPEDITAPGEPAISPARRPDQVSFETKLLTKIGRQIPAECNIQTFRLGSEDTVVVVVRDISKRRQRETELKTLASELETIFNCVPTPILFFDALEDGTFRRCRSNAAVARLSGFPESCNGKALTDYRTAAEAAEIEAYLRDCVSTGLPRSYTAERDYPVGRRFIQALLTPVAVGGQVTRVVSSIHDLTEIKTLADELQ